MRDRMAGREVWPETAVPSSDPQVGAVSLAANGGARLAVTNHPVLRIDLLGDAGVWVGEDRLRFPTHRAELAVFCLALAGPGGLHQEVLTERLWPCAPADRGPARLRTLLWQVRRTFDRDAWRVQRRANRVVVALDGATVDVLMVRGMAATLLAADSAVATAARAVIAELSEPLLIGWQFEPWVQAEQERNAELVLALARRITHGQ